MIRFHYNPSFKDYVALNRHVIWPRFRMPAIFLGLFFTAYCFHPLALRMLGRRDASSDEPLSGAPLFIGPVVVLMIAHFWRSNMKKSWDRASELRAERDYEISEKGINVVGPSFSGFIEWQYIERAERTGGYFFLKTYQNLYYYFPESAIAEPQSLIELLATKFPKK